MGSDTEQMNSLLLVGLLINEKIINDELKLIAFLKVQSNHGGEMVVTDVVLDVGIAIVFVNHLVSLGKTGLELILLLGRIQLGVMFGLEKHQLIAVIVINQKSCKF